MMSQSAVNSSTTFLKLSLTTTMPGAMPTVPIVYSRSVDSLTSFLAISSCADESTFPL